MTCKLRDNSFRIDESHRRNCRWRILRLRPIVDAASAILTSYRVSMRHGIPDLDFRLRYTYSILLRSRSDYDAGKFRKKHNPDRVFCNWQWHTSPVIRERELDLRDCAGQRRRAEPAGNSYRNITRSILSNYPANFSPLIPFWSSFVVPAAWFLQRACNVLEHTPVPKYDRYKLCAHNRMFKIKKCCSSEEKRSEKRWKYIHKRFSIEWRFAIS